MKYGKLMIKGTMLQTMLSLFAVLNLQGQHVDIAGKVKITEMDTVTSGSTAVVREADGTLAIRGYKIGDLAQGGIVFWVDGTGDHGLSCAETDQSPGIRWYAGTNGNTQASADGVYAGEVNTSVAIAAQVAIGDDGNSYAARLCNELQIAEGEKIYGDWYLPSKEELYLMWQNLHRYGCVADTTLEVLPPCPTALGGFDSDDYWSSTEFDKSGTNAWIQFFGDFTQDANTKSNTSRVRAIRSF